MRRRVVVTGMGAITPLGTSVAETWQAEVEGRSGIGPITLFDASTFPTRIAGEVKEFDFSPWFAKEPQLKSVGRNTQFAIAACQEAWDDAGLSRGNLDRSRIGIYFAAGEGAFDYARFARTLAQAMNDGNGDVDIARFLLKGLEQFDAMVELEQEPAMTVAHLARIFQVRGPSSNCLTACAASSQAIGEACEIIRRGNADLMISGGAHSMVHPFGIAGFSLLTTLSTRNEEPQRASRPFDRCRDGFVLSEGAGAVILEELSHALKRRSRIYGELIGYGTTADAYRLTDTHPEGRGAMKAMELAIRDAGLTPADIHYINAHGTSTVVNDQIETVAIKTLMGDETYRIPVSSTKSMTGHLIAAAGAVELISTLLAVQHDLLPPTINYEEPDPECDLDYVPNQARTARCDAAMSNSFGFGGQNVTLVVRKFHP